MSAQVACSVADLAPGEALLAKLTATNGRTVDVAVVRSDDGNFYAINDVCSHGQVSLSEGEVEGCEIECWAHGARFDVRTGEATQLPAMSPVATYPVSVDGNQVLVDVDSPQLSMKENA